jgi:conjugal transfer/entry exclusion protein
MHRILLWPVLLTLPYVPLAQAQWAVVDVAAIAQSLENTVQTAAVVANTAQSVQNEYNIIVQQIEQYKTMVKNLQRLPEGLNVLDAVRGWSNQITGLLGNANIISYNLDQVGAQFDRLYQQIGTLQNPADVLALRQRLLGARLEASQMTVQVTAIKANLTELYSRMCALLDGAYTSQGNLDIQQVQAMQLGLIQHTMESQATMQAAQARNTAQYQAEQVTIERIQIQSIQGAMGAAAPLGEPQGKLPRFHW